MKKVYLASQIEAEGTMIRNNAETAASILQDRGFDVYCPWKMCLPNAWDYPNTEWGLMVFSADVVELDKADIVVVLSYGRIGTCGTAWEAGYAFAKGKKVIVVEADSSKPIMSLMIANGRWATLSSIEDLRNYDFSEMPKLRTNTEQK